ncbi:MAG: AtpZ/AtpI family protein [Planctomycetota bacterium]
MTVSDRSDEADRPDPPSLASTSAPPPAGSQRTSPLRALHLGSTLAASVLLGVGIGWWIDQHWGTEPWATVSGAVLFIVAGIYHAIRDELR